jgi:hypothetical protein
VHWLQHYCRKWTPELNYASTQTVVWEDGWIIKAGRYCREGQSHMMYGLHSP